MRFEVTPAYSFWPQSMDRLQRYNPDARIILLFRDPFERAWSHWCMQYARGKETLSFASAIRTERHRLEGLPPDAVERRYFSYVGRGRYGSQLRRILALFPRDQLLLLTAEAFARDQSGILASISDFLGIDGFPPMPPAWEHRRPAIPYPCEPRDEDRALIYDLLREEMDELAEHTRSHIRYPMHDPFRPGSDQAQEKPPPIR
nr:sulfotransferase [Sphingobium sp. BYY-5]